MEGAHRCHVTGCAVLATYRCFECGAPCCDGHRSAIQIPTETEPFHEDLCAACLQMHLEAPDRYGSIAIEWLAPGMGVGDVESLELGL